MPRFPYAWPSPCAPALPHPASWQQRHAAVVYPTRTSGLRCCRASPSTRSGRTTGLPRFVLQAAEGAGWGRRSTARHLCLCSCARAHARVYATQNHSRQSHSCFCVDDSRLPLGGSLASSAHEWLLQHLAAVIAQRGIAAATATACRGLTLQVRQSGGRLVFCQERRARLFVMPNTPRAPNNPKLSEAG